jgi:hypothetical protein
MSYSQKDVLFENLTVTTNPITNNTPKITQNYKITLAQGQNITYARIYASVKTTSINLLGSAVRLYLNGSLLQIFNIDAFDQTEKTFQQDITNELLANSVNSFEFDFDGSLEVVDFVVYADVYFSLNTSTPPVSHGNQGPPATPIIATLKSIETPLLVGGGIIAGLYVISKIFK